MPSFFPIVPLLVLAASVAGLVLVTLGLRGRPVFATPRCRKCGYDLRNMQFMSDAIGNCPECGAPLAGPNGVSFGRWQRRPKQIVLGAVLLALPWLAAMSATYLLRRAAPMNPGNMPSQSTPAILASLPQNVTTPWHWQELQRRLTAGQLTTADVDAAFAALAAHLDANRAAGRAREPLHWSGNFVAAAIAAKSVTQPQVDALCRAYYGDAPPMMLRDRARAGESIPVVFNQHDPWDLEGMQRCWALTSIVADGTTALTPMHHHGEKQPLTGDVLSGTGRDGQLHATFPHALAPGEHELAFTYELGVVSNQATFRGLDGKPGTPDKWPAPVSRWQATVKRKVTVVPKDQPLVTLVIDEAKNPFTSSTISIDQMLVRPATKGVELVIKWKVVGTPSPPVSYRVWVQAAAEKIDYGTLVNGRMGRGSVSSMSDRKRIPSLPPDVKTVNILLTPDPKAAEQFIQIDSIWGQPLEIKNVAVQRFDLENAQ